MFSHLEFKIVTICHICFIFTYVNRWNFLNHLKVGQRQHETLSCLFSDSISKNKDFLLHNQDSITTSGQLAIPRYNVKSLIV